MSVHTRLEDAESEATSEESLDPLLTGRLAQSTEIHVLVCCDNEFRRPSSMRFYLLAMAGTLLSRTQIFDSVSEVDDVGAFAVFSHVFEAPQDERLEGTTFRLLIEFQTSDDLRFLQWRLADYYVATYDASDVGSLKRASSHIQEMNETYAAMEGRWSEGPPTAIFVGTLEDVRPKARSEIRNRRSRESRLPDQIPTEVLTEICRGIYNAPWDVTLRRSQPNAIKDLFEEIATCEYSAGYVANAADVDGMRSEMVHVPVLSRLPSVESPEIGDCCATFLGSGSQSHLYVVGDRGPDDSGTYKIVDGVHPFFSTRSARVGRSASFVLVAVAVALGLLCTLLFSILGASGVSYPPWSVVVTSIFVVIVGVVGLVGLMFSLRLTVRFLSESVIWESYLFSCVLRKVELPHSSIRRFSMKRVWNVHGLEDYVTICEYVTSSGHLDYKGVHRQSGLNDEKRVCRECNLEVLFLSSIVERADDDSV